MSNIRTIIKDLVDTIPEEKLKKVFDVLEDLAERDIEEAWSIWGELGKDAVEGKWKDASEKHDYYLYGLKG